MFGKCGHGVSFIELLCQAVGTLSRCWEVLQLIDGRLHRMERYLVAHVPDYPQAPPAELEALKLKLRGIPPVAGDKEVSGA